MTDLNTPVPFDKQGFVLNASVDKLTAENTDLRRENQVLQHQLEWFKRQLFGEKSEQRLIDVPPEQGQLFAAESSGPLPAPEATVIPAHQRRKKQRNADDVLESGLRFTDDVPVRVIDRTPDALKGDNAADYVILGYDCTYRLAQRVGSYEVLEYRTPRYKPKGEAAIHHVPAPANVLENSCVDVSLLAGLLVDKFAYHLPVHRQHQRLKDAGITVARSSLLNWCGRAIELLEPIVHAQYQSILTSRVLGMDETPIKAGKAKTKGKMKQGYLWPMYGDQDEVIFHFNPSRGSKVIQEQLGQQFDGVLLCDGYAAYKTYAKNKDNNATLANCWSHSRRQFEAVKTIDPLACEEALQLIGALYHNEAHIRDHELEGQTKLDYRTQHSEPIVKQFWQWCEAQQQRPDLFPKHPLQKALNYVRERIEPLQVFLSDPDVPLDTNHVERALRGIPLGRKNWMFCWTEMGARQVGIIQSLIVTCRLHGINPYQYLVDVLQRIAIHPAKQVEELTPRRWKTQFADHPMLSDVNREI